MITTVMTSIKPKKIKAKNEREIEDDNKDHYKDNENLNELNCVNDTQNLNDVFDQLLVEEGIGDVVVREEKTSNNSSEQNKLGG